MDTLRLILAIVLTIAVIIITNILFPPVRTPAPEQAPVDTVRVVEEVAPDTSAAGEPQTVEPPALPPSDEETDAPLAQPTQGPAPPADTAYATSPLYRFGVSTAGAGIIWAELLEFESFTRAGAVQLVPEDAGPLIGYRLRMGDRVLELSRLPFRITQVDGDAGPGSVVDLVYEDPSTDLAVGVRYAFDAESYVAEVTFQVSGAPGADRLLVDLGPALATNEADEQADRTALGYAVNSTTEGIESVPLSDVEAQRVEEGPLLWVAMKSKYFLAAVLRQPGSEPRYFGGAIADDAPGDFRARVSASVPLGEDGIARYRLYLGPQDYERLAEAGEALEDVNPMGWAIFRPIIRPIGHAITWALVEMRQLFGIGYGWVLILFGFLVQLILWPLNTRAMRSQIRNMELQPVLKEIQEKYKEQPEKLQKEMIRLYKEKGFNPFGGCLPMLIPYPVLITLFFVFQGTIEFRGVDFLWLPDLSRPDPLYILPIVLGASMFAMQWLTARSTKTQNPQMKMMMWIMPGVMVVIFFNLAAGLNLYYAASNVASIPRQFQIMRERRQAGERTSGES